MTCAEALGDWALTLPGQEVDAREEARRKADPLSALNVGAFVADLFRRVATEQRQVFEAGAAELTPVQLQALQRVFGQG